MTALARPVTTDVARPPMIHVRVWTDAITGDPVDVWCPLGSTIAEIMAALPLPEERKALRDRYEVWLGEHLVPRANWRLVRPAAWARERPVTMTVRLPVRGGGGRGGAKLLSVVAAIALISLTAWIGGGGLGFLGSAFQAGAWGARVAAAGASILGALALQGLMPKQRRESKDPLSFASATNDFAPGDRLQRVIGRAQVVPQIVVPPFTTLLKGVTKANRVTRYDQTVTVVYALAGRHDIESISVDGVDVSTVSGLEVETREGLSTDTHLTLVTDTRIEEQVGTQLSTWEVDPDDADGTVEIIGTTAQSEPRWHTVETKKGCDAFILEYVLPSGLLFTAASGNRAAGCVVLRHRMRRRGSSSWGGYVNLPQLLIRAKEGNDPIRVQLEIRWVDRLPSTAGNSWPSTPNPPAGIRDAARVRGWCAVYEPGDGSWTSPLITSSPKAPNAKAEWEWQSDTRVVLYLLKSKYPQGRWQVDVKRSWNINGNYFKFANYRYEGQNATTYDVFSPPIAAAGSALQKLDQNPSCFQDTITLTMVQSVYDEYPIGDDGNPLTLFALRRKAAPIGRVSAVVTGVCGSWNGSTWVQAATRNPADWYRDVHIGPHNAQPTPSALVDSATLAAWAEDCDANGYEIGLVVKDKSVEEVLAACCRAGFASPDPGAKYSVVMDRRRTTPAGLISQRNARNFTFRKAFDDLPHALRITFQDSVDDFATREITVYLPGYGPTASAGVIEATLFEASTDEESKTETQARERAERNIGWLLWRSTLLGCEADFEHLEYRRGSLMLWDMDILGAVTGRGLITGLVLDGSGRITAIDIDEEQVLVGSDADLWDVKDLWRVTDLWTVGRFGAAIRRQDGTLVIVEAASGSTSTRLLLAAPLTMPKSGSRNLIGEGDLVTCGALGTVSREVIILEIASGGDLTATITAVDHAADAIYGGT